MAFMMLRTQRRHRIARSVVVACAIRPDNLWNLQFFKRDLWSTRLRMAGIWSEVASANMNDWRKISSCGHIVHWMPQSTSLLLFQFGVFILSDINFVNTTHLSHNVRKRTFKRVRSAKIQISLCIRGLIRIFTGRIFDSQGCIVS